MNQEWIVGTVMVSVDDAVKMLYKDGQRPVSKWFKAYSNNIAEFKSHVRNKAGILYHGLKKYI